MAAQRFDFRDSYRIEQGSTFTVEITVTTDAGEVYDLIGATCAAQLRQTKDAAATVAFGVAINTVTGVITLTLTAVQTAAITFTSGYWDCELTEGAVVTRLLEGEVDISQEVTK